MADTYPSPITTFNVVGRLVKAVGDGADVDSNPDVMPIVGAKIMFTPSLDPPIFRVPTAVPPVTVFQETVMATTDADGFLRDLDDPAEGVTLAYGGDPNIIPTGWTWLVQIDVGGNFPIITGTIHGNPNKPVDIADVLPLPPNPGDQLTPWLKAVVEATTARDVAVAAAERLSKVEVTNSGVMAAVVRDPNAQFTKALMANTNAQIKSEVTPIVVKLIAEDATVSAAAAEAVVNEAHARDLIQRGDPGVAFPVSLADAWAHFVTDQDGYIASGTRPDGTSYFARVELGDINNERFEQVESDTLVRMVTDEDGYIAEPMSITVEGRTPNWVLRNHKERGACALLGVATYGDSMTQGNLNGAKPWQGPMGELIPVSITNYGVSGQTSTEVALRNGGLDVWVTVANNQIPASGTVNVTVLPIEQWRPSNAWSFAGTIGDIQGVLRKASNGDWTFTRNAAGTAVSVPPESRFISSQKVGAMVGRILWAGRNNLTQATIVRDIKAMVSDAVRVGAPYLVLPVFNSTTESRGTSGYNSVMAVNAALEQEYGPNFYDARGFLIRHGLSQAGISPTVDDTSAIAQDRIPASFMADTLHLNTAGNLVLGQRLAYVTTQKGWYYE